MLKNTPRYVLLYGRARNGCEDSNYLVLNASTLEQARECLPEALLIACSDDGDAAYENFDDLDYSLRGLHLIEISSWADLDLVFADDDKPTELGARVKALIESNVREKEQRRAVYLRLKKEFEAE